VATTKTAKNRTSRNDTPNTPDVSESKIARMKVDELRRELKSRGVKGTEGLKKPELVNKLIKAEVRSAKGGRKKPTSRNDTPNTPEVSESKIARMKASELRTRLARRGVTGTADMKKPELVERFVKAELKSAKNGKTKGRSAKGGRKNQTSRNDTPNTPEISESEIGRMKVAELRTRLARQGIDGTAGLKKPELVKKLVKSLTGKAGKSSGGKRAGKNTSRSLRYSQEITSTADRPERAGRSLVTTDHEVIRQWAKARRAVPATVAGTHHDGHLGVLQFDFPGYSGGRLVEVSWAEWFEAFDKRRLNFIYQDRRSGGERSNFFQLENPDQ
jgi:hypothetical protein